MGSKFILIDLNDVPCTGPFLFVEGFMAHETELLC